MEDTSPSPIVSVVVPCRGHAHVLRPCLEGLMRQQLDAAHEVIVVDGASDPAVAAVTNEYATVRLVRSEAGLLPGEARNLGVEHARGEHLAFIDADCRPDPEWLGAAIDALQRGARLVGGPVTDALPWHPIALADNLLQFADFPATRPEGPATYFPSCNLAMRRADFHTLGGFRHGSQPVGEDTALCDVALEHWPDGLRFARGMKVRHTGRTSLGGLLRHMYVFGLARGALGLHLKPSHRRYGRWAIMVPPVALKRLAYIIKRTAQWRPLGLIKVLLLSPLLLLGLIAWAIGFRRGLLTHVEEAR